jgi:hypothetical protein
MKKKTSILFVFAFAGLLMTSCGPQGTSSSPAAVSSPAYSSSEPVSSSPSSPLKVKAVTLYVLTDSGVEDQTVNEYFLDGYGDVPFLNISNSLDIMQRSLSDSTVTTSGTSVTIGRTENAETIVFDFAQKTVHYSNLDVYASNHYKDSVLDLVSDQGEKDGKKKYLASQNIAFNRTGVPVTLDLNHYAIPMYFEAGSGYIPVQTFADLVLSERNIFLITNGKNLFMSGAWFDDSTEMTNLFYSVDKSDRSKEMAQFSYNELILALDVQYGLKEDHAITDFASYIPQVSGLKDRLLSTDALEADKGVYQLCSQAFGDFHSYLESTSAYAGKDNLAAAKDASLQSPNFTEYQLIRVAFNTARTTVLKALGKTAFDPYEEYDNGDGTTTAFVTFDNFTMPTSDYYTTPASASAKDTYGVIEYAHSQIFKTGSTVKNVVLDLSCNSGGSINAGVYTLGWFLPYGILNAKNTLTGAQGSFTYASDVNMDGVYDKNDWLITNTNLHLYCLISPASFSCSNFVAAGFKDSDQVRLIGRHTSGGGCIVEHLATADGTLFATSGNRQLASVRNGAFTSIDDGVEADITLDNYLDFYDRAALAKKLASY